MPEVLILPEIHNTVITPPKKLKVVLVGLCSYRNFPVRVMHPMLEKIPGVEVHSIFVKEFEGRLYHQLTEKEKKYFCDLIQRFEPDLVAFSVLYPFFPITKTLMKLIKQVAPSAHILLGGHHPTTCPELCVKQAPEADILCVGEGDYAIVKLVEALRDNKPYHNIENLWVRHNGTVVQNQRGALLEDLDSLPFPAYSKDEFYFIDKNTLSQHDPLPQYKDLYVMGSRGCPFLCTFCGNTVLRGDFKGLGKFIRRRSVDSLLAEIKEHLSLPNNKTQFVFFFDENFSLEMDWLDEFCTKYKKEIGLPFQVSYNPHRLGPELIEKLVDAGLDSLRIGIQTGSDFIRRKVYNRPGKNSDLIEITRNSAKHNISMRHDIILDNPYETEEHIKEAIDLLLQLPKASHTDLYSLQYYPNFPLTKKALEDKIIPPLEEISDEDIEKTSTDVAYVPFLFPFTQKQWLQNTLWLIKGDHVSHKLVKYAAFGNSFGSKICLQYMNLKAVLLGKIVGDGGLVDKYPWLMFTIKGLAFIIKGDFKGFWKRVERRLALKRDFAFAQSFEKGKGPGIKSVMPWSRHYQSS
ncbi:MAG: hypothetical protein A2Z88_02055 [Omnitrophica WOR_2 bacterium GWA2_47_8]|nr:MAG: hypothetical protein A2Z88_02055 [Omnitrophica WOR_2 bacterium GWA2_47_8]